MAGMLVMTDKQSELIFELNEQAVKQALGKNIKRYILMVQIRDKCDKETAIKEVNKFLTECIKNEEEKEV